jgi:hypothetical protein
MQIHFFVFNGSPQPLSKNIVKCPSFPIHTDFHLCGLQELPILRTREVTPLIAITDCWDRHRQGTFECGQDKGQFQCLV